MGYLSSRASGDRLRQKGPFARILLHQFAPLGLRQILTGFDVKTAYKMGWDRLENGKLLTAAEQAGFSIKVSADQNIWHQQRLAGRQIALIVLTTNHRDTIRAVPEYIRQVRDQAKDSDSRVIELPLPPLRRRSLSASQSLIHLKN